MGDELTLAIQSTFGSLHSATETVAGWLSERNVPGGIQYFAHLAVEELVTNCIKYGYEDAVEHTIEIKLRLSEKELILTVIDDGRPFNPLESATPDLTSPVQDRPIGGLGIYLVRQMANQLEYHYAEGRNITTAYKALGGQ